MRFTSQPIGRDPRDRRTQYQRGADFERKVRDHFMFDHDATYVVRSAGSRGIVDLVVFFGAVDNTDSEGNEFGIVPQGFLVQCKNDGKISDEDKELLLSLSAEVGFDAILAYKDERGHVEWKNLTDEEYKREREEERLARAREAQDDDGYPTVKL